MPEAVRSASPQEWSQSSFDELIAGEPLGIVVEFGAAWCPPCAAMAPVLEALAHDRRDRLVVATVDVDAEPELARRLGIVSVPTTLVYLGGELRRRLVGARSGARLVAEVDEALSERR